MTAPAPFTADCTFAIIGAGFAGLCMAIRLKQSGIEDFVVLERDPRPGGTWRDNTYPGCACDVPSHLYSYSFAQNREWSEVFAPWHEIQAYLERCVLEFKLGPHLRHDTNVEALRFDAETQRWHLKLGDGRELRAQFVASATGPLNKPAIPDIPGLGDFKGKVFHSSQWDHDHDLTGKRVAVVGTGASAIQIVPSIAPKVAQLDLYQRTPPWVMPRFNRVYSAIERKLFRHLPGWAWLVRKVVYWRLELFGLALLRDGRARRIFERLGAWHRERQLADPQLRAKVTPDYRIGCKRVLLSDDYYPSLARDNVSLVTDAIERITADGVRTVAGEERKVDALVLATGFRATEFLTPMRVYAADGRELSEVWRAGAMSYLGINVSGFPNFFMLVGPNTGLGHNSIIFMMEAQVNFVMDCLRQLRLRNADSADVRAEAQYHYMLEMQQRLQGTAWLSGCKSWYLSPDGHNYTLWPGFTPEYWRRTQHFDPNLYTLR